MLPSFYFFLFLLKFRSSTRCSPLYRTIEKQSSSYTRSFIPIEIKISSCAPRRIFFSRIQIHVLPFAIVIQPFYNYGIFFFFLVSWQNWLVLWIWMQVGVSQSLVSRMGLPECDERVCCFSISEEWNATPLVSVLETLVAERVIRQEFALSKTRFFFFSPFSKKEKMFEMTESCPLIQDRSDGALHPCTCHLLKVIDDRFLFSQRFPTPLIG